MSEDRITTFDQLLSIVKGRERKRLAIAAAEGEEIIEAVKQAVEEGIISPLLVGDQAKLTELCGKKNLDLTEVEIVHAPDPTLAAKAAVEAVKQGKAEMLMKGKVNTSTLLKAVLDKESGLRTGAFLSHVAVIEVESYPKLMLVTDGGMNIRPDIKQKAEIIDNAVEVAKRLGVERPKVSCLAAVELVNPDMQETVDAAGLVKMAERGDIKDVIMDGPIAFDAAINREAARTKGIISPVAGDSDIFLVPDIASGNIFVKSLIYLAGAKVGGLVVGAGAPIVLLSRSDSAQTKLYSIALGAKIT
ncbi:MAG: bifunctional enoyl-CoA hydratase/phosphate acetyltransferase [Candidatus Zixiibacteriota bacterium]|nr:MAG: bifunctional enoyl-CoA hydratase/phosphate acetyltransferase [candidate division Zixibacteria bacterium]